MKLSAQCLRIAAAWERYIIDHLEPGSDAELIAALGRFRDAVAREPHRQLVRVLRPRGC